MSAIGALKLIQPLSILALVAVLVFRRAAWSERARLPVAIVAFICSAALLFYHIL